MSDENGSIPHLAEALAAARKDFGPIVRSKTVTVKTTTGATYAFSYAPFEAMVAATMPALATNGLAVIQSAHEGVMVSTLIHSSGEQVSSHVPICMPDKARPQEVGSALQYARRYGYNLLLCLAADDDDDANIAEGNTVEVHKRPQAVKVAPGATKSSPADTRSKTADDARVERVSALWGETSRLLKRAAAIGAVDAAVTDVTKGGTDARNALFKELLGVKELPTPWQPATLEFINAALGRVIDNSTPPAEPEGAA